MRLIQDTTRCFPKMIFVSLHSSTAQRHNKGIIGSVISSENLDNDFKIKRDYSYFKNYKNVIVIIKKFRGGR